MIWIAYLGECRLYFKIMYLHEKSRMKKKKNVRRLETKL